MADPFTPVHPLANIDMFQEVSPLFSRPELARHDSRDWFGESRNSLNHFAQRRRNGACSLA